MANYLDHVILDKENDYKTVYIKPGLATQTKEGLMSAADKKKLDEINPGANFYELPVATGTDLGGVMLGYIDDAAKVALNLSAENKGYVTLTKSAIIAALGFTPQEEGEDEEYELPVATGVSLGGIKIKYEEKDADLAVKLDASQKAYIRLTANAIEAALGYTPANSEEPYQLPVATAPKLGGIKIGYVDKQANVAVKLDESNKSYVELTKNAIEEALGYEPVDPDFMPECNLNAEVFSMNNYDDSNISAALLSGLSGM